MKAKLIALISSLVLLLILFAACHKRPAPKTVADTTLPPIGKACTVQLRRDALGAASPNPIPPLTDMHNGAETSVGGKLKSVTPEWIVLDRTGHELWIPKSSVLLVQF